MLSRPKRDGEVWSWKFQRDVPRDMSLRNRDTDLRFIRNRIRILCVERDRINRICTRTYPSRWNRHYSDSHWKCWPLTESWLRRRWRVCHIPWSIRWRGKGCHDLMPQPRREDICSSDLMFNIRHWVRVRRRRWKREGRSKDRGIIRKHKSIEKSRRRNGWDGKRDGIGIRASCKEDLFIDRSKTPFFAYFFRVDLLALDFHLILHEFACLFVWN